ncbi:hypothetical protein ABGT15_14760, partial [Flavobacterium enshiense]|uniref:hypothetical protein n=1 Tax=Flavobacterium enshiense TaxID=1341165 RepID=UPI00345DDCB5
VLHYHRQDARFADAAGRKNRGRPEVIVLFHEGQEVPDDIRQALGVKSQGETVKQGKAFVVAPSGRVAEGFASKEQAQDFVKRLHTLIT